MNFTIRLTVGQITTANTQGYVDDSSTLARRCYFPSIGTEEYSLPALFSVCGALFARYHLCVYLQQNAIKQLIITNPNPILTVTENNF